MSKSVSLTANKDVNKPEGNKPSGVKKGGVESKAEFRGKGIEDSTNPQGGIKNKMSVGVFTGMHGKSTGGHPTHRASEFSGKGSGYHTDCGK